MGVKIIFRNLVAFQNTYFFFFACELTFFQLFARIFARNWNKNYRTFQNLRRKMYFRTWPPMHDELWNTNYGAILLPFNAGIRITALLFLISWYSRSAGSNAINTAPIAKGASYFHSLGTLQSRRTFLKIQIQISRIFSNHSSF